MRRSSTLIIISLLFSKIAFAATINVPADQATIQLGLNVAQSGDTVLVQPGTYIENIFWSSVNGIKLFSAGDSSNTIINGNGSGSVISFLFSQGLDTTTVVQGFKIINGGATHGGGIYLTDNSIKIRDCGISNCYGGGIYLSNSNSVLRNCHILENDGGGISFLNNSNIIIDSCTINDNFNNPSGGGIYCDSSSPTLTNLTISNNTLPGGDPNNGGGIYCINNSNPKIRNVVISNNSRGGIYISDSNPIIEDVEITGNSKNVNGGAGLLCYRSSPSVINITVNNNSGIGILCWFSSNPEISNAVISNNSYATSTAGVDIYDNSNPTFSDVSVINNSGRGINIDKNSNPILNNIEIKNNKLWGTYNSGAGIKVSKGHLKINNGIISNNQTIGSYASGGGVYILYNASATFINVDIHNNTAKHNGGGIYLSENINFTFTDLKIVSNVSQNDGGGIYWGSTSNGTLSNVLIYDNIANNFGGGIHIYASDPSISNIIISNNYALKGSGVYLNTSNPTLNQINVCNNHAENLGGGIYCNGSSNPNIYSSTISGNSSLDLGDGVYTISNATLQNCNICYNDIGIYNQDNSQFVQATDNWWGDESGPYHQIYNPNGLGDTTNAFVNVIPFLTNPDINAPPIPVQNPSITATGSDFISMSWDTSAISDLSGYKVYYDTDTTGYPYDNYIDVGNITSYSLSGLNAGITYYIAVTCYDTDGNESWYSDEIITIMDLVEVRNLDVGGSDDIFHIWDLNPMINWHYYDLLSLPQSIYQIQVGLDTDWTTAEMWDTGEINSPDTFAVYSGSTLHEDSTYYIRVRVNNGTIWSSWADTSFGLNSYPQMSLIDTSVVEDDTLILNLNEFIFDSDDSDSALNISVIQSENIITNIDSVNHNVSFIPKENWNGSEAINFICEDPWGYQASDSLILTVLPRNDFPVIVTTELPNAIEDENYSCNILVTDEDLIYGDNISYSLSVYPEGMTINTTTGEINWIPDNEDVGDTTVTVIVTDDSSATDTSTYILTVINVNDRPVLSTLPDTSFNEDTILEIPISFWYNYVEDVDNDDSELMWTFFGGDSVIVNASTDNVIFSAPLNWFGIDTIEVAVSDGEYSDTSSLELTVYPVNDSPVITEIPDQSFAINDTVQIFLNQYVSDPDLPNDNISWTCYTGENLLIMFVDSIARITNVFGWLGTDSVLFIATDESMSSDSSWVNFTVVPIYSPRNLSSKSGLTYVPLIWNKPGPQIEELIYDNGSPTGASTGFIGCKTACRLTPPWPCKVVALKFYVNVQSTVTFLPGIYSWNGTSPGEVIKEFNHTIDASGWWYGWEYIDVSEYDIMVNDDFVVSCEYIVDYDPSIGINSEDNGRGWSLNPSYSSNWIQDEYTYFIRAIVEKIPGSKGGDTKEITELQAFGASNYSFGEDVSYYNIYRSNISGSSFELIESGIEDTTYSDLNVELGTNYYYVVTGVYSEPFAESEYSNEASATTAFPPVLSSIPDTSFFEDDSLYFPVAILQNYVQDEDTPVDSLHWIVSQNQNVYFNFENDSVFISAEANWFGKDTVLLIVSDDVLSDSSNWIITVHPVNDPPYFTELMPDSISFNSNVSDTLLLTELASDIDNPDSILIWSYIHSSFVSCDINDTLRCAIIWVGENISGKDTVVLSVSDGELTIYDSLIVIVSPVTGIEYMMNQIPKEYSLNQNYPNPFNPTTTIIYSIPTHSNVDIRIYDLLGKEVVTLVNDEQEAKYYKIIWDAKDRFGNSVPSGMYFYRIVAKSNDRVFTKTKKLLLLR